MTHTHFPPPPSRVAGSATSKAAAAAAQPHAGSQRERINRYVAGNSLATREQISDALGLSQTSVAPRVAQLLQAGLLRVVDDQRVTRNGYKAERLMVSGKPYSEAPPPDTRQLQLPLPLSALSPAEQAEVAVSLPPAMPRDPNAAERARVAADQAKVAREREEFRRLEAEHGAALDALNDEQRTGLVQRLPANLQAGLRLSPSSKIIRFELLKLLEQDCNRPHFKEPRS